MNILLSTNRRIEQTAAFYPRCVSNCVLYHHVPYLTYWCRVLYEINYLPRTGDTNAFETLFCPLQTVRVIIVYIRSPSRFRIFSVTALLLQLPFDGAPETAATSVFVLTVSSFLLNFCFKSVEYTSTIIQLLNLSLDNL